MFTVADLLVAASGRLVHGDLGRVCTGVSTDSRTLQRGQLFVALVGPCFDGHRFVGEAVAKGAAAIVVAEDHAREVAGQWAGGPADASVSLIEVFDTLRALGDIAQAHRRRSTVRVVAVTGSSGKTTTKELIAAVLRVRYRVLSSEGTQNNLIGVPSTLLQLQPHHEIAVVECGTSQPGEIARLAEIAEPDVSVVTAVGPAHLEGLGSLEGVGREKRALVDGVRQPGTAVLNGDDPVLRSWLRNLPSGVQAVSYGYGADASLRATDVRVGNGSTSFRVNGRWEVTWSMLGRHNVLNALAACGVGNLFGVPWEEMCGALRRVTPMRGRLSVVRAGCVTLIDDAYNANPLSVQRALEVLQEFPCSGRRFFVFGDMRELGGSSAEWHRRVGQAASKVAQVIVTVGDLASLAAEAASQSRAAGNGVYRCQGNAEAVECLRSLLQPEDVVLVKGSHASGMHQVIDAIQRDGVMV